MSEKNTQKPAQSAPVAVRSEPDEYRERQRKLQELRAKPGEAFPNDFRPSQVVQEIIERFGNIDATELNAQSHGGSLKPEALAGRVVGKRLMGKAAFLHVRDRSGTLQIYLKMDRLGNEAYENVKHVDLGDIIGVIGVPFRTKTNELTLECHAFRLLCKALRPLPEKWHGLQDVETRYRQRYLDLISNEKTRQTFLIRSRVIQKIRQFFAARDFLEVETPMMQPLAGGAAARPFITHHNALDMELYLRIAPELYLKRLVVGGFERVFEINRNFRNEGISIQHNPEFTMLEFYQAYATYEDLMELTEELLNSLVRDISGANEDLTYQGQSLSFKRPWRRLTLTQAVKDYFNSHTDSKIKALGSLDIDDMADLKKMLKVTGTINEKLTESIGQYQAHLFEELVEKTLIQPTFVTQYPVAVSPLSRRNQARPEYVDRFELIVAGREIANAFSELNDPEDQRARFEEQMKKRELGDVEAMPIDEDFIRALEHGMPPTAGEGIGIDRLVMLLTDAPSIREVILFPMLRLNQADAS